MTFLENLEPLLKAVEQYAHYTNMHELAEKNGGNPLQTATLQSEAEHNLLQAALKYTEWGK